MDHISKLVQFMIEYDEAGKDHLLCFGYFLACQENNNYTQAIKMAAKKFHYGENTVRNIIAEYGKHFEELLP